MWEGSVVSIHVAATEGGALTPLQAVHAVPGYGLEGDRYYTFAKAGGIRPDQEITLVAEESVEEFNKEYGTAIKPEESRRNIVTRGVPLNELVGRDFQVGEVTVRGHRLCEPCTDLVKYTGREEILPGLVHRAGMRAQVLTEGVIRVGDAVRVGDVMPAEAADGAQMGNAVRES